MTTTETILKHEEVITSASAEKSNSPADFPPEKPDSPDALAAAIIEAQPKQTWRSHIWDTLDKSPEERRFLFKFDAIVLTFASLGFFIKILDQYNINTAFISGMQKDLNLVGNELNYMSSVYTAGYTLGMIPR
jgi:ACS family pantothenate transporter-like MFS transporter